MKISVIIPYAALNGEEETLKNNCISSLKPTNDELEIIVQEDYKLEGYVKTINKGLSKATGDIIALLNQDIKAFPYWSTRLREFLTKDIGGICARESDRAYFDPMADVIEEKKNFFGSFWIMRREVFEKVGYLDKRFSPYLFGDRDYLYRILNSGYKLLQDQRCNIWHKQASSTGKLPHYQDIYNRNRQKFYEKHGVDAVELFH